jgi:Acetylornithine deacetylase/Succinyl-diaminopimelate desuccinylase and related deacylases
LNEWTHDPFDPVIEGNLLLARGSSDMKGQAMIVLSAIKSILAFDSLPVNLKFLFEGDEEVGSPQHCPFF